LNSISVLQCKVLVNCINLFLEKLHIQRLKLKISSLKNTKLLIPETIKHLELLPQFGDSFCAVQFMREEIDKLEEGKKEHGIKRHSLQSLHVTVVNSVSDLQVLVILAKYQTNLTRLTIENLKLRKECTKKLKELRMLKLLHIINGEISYKYLLKVKRNNVNLFTQLDNCVMTL
jgi:hypothetical protein